MNDLALMLACNLKDCKIEEDFDFSEHTTIGVGGKAESAVYPCSVEAMVSAIAFFKENGIPYIILGAGANVLPSDKGFSGAVLKTDFLNEIKITGENKIFAECGVRVSKLLNFANESSMGGISFMAGIPASVGGAVFMNAGISEGHIGDKIGRVLAISPNGEVVWLSKSECCFSYKRTFFSEEGFTVLGAELNLEFCEKESAKQEIARVLQNRKRLPRGKSMGCVFKNPNGVSAGALIEKVGLKGTRKGGALISPLHANFIINTGGAASSDITDLIGLMKREVYAYSKIRLEEEIRYIGDY